MLTLFTAVGHLMMQKTEYGRRLPIVRVNKKSMPLRPGNSFSGPDWLSRSSPKKSCSGSIRQESNTRICPEIRTSTIF